MPGGKEGAISTLKISHVIVCGFLSIATFLKPWVSSYLVLLLLSKG